MHEYIWFSNFDQPCKDTNTISSQQCRFSTCLFEQIIWWSRCWPFDDSELVWSAARLSFVNDLYVWDLFQEAFMVPLTECMWKLFLLFWNVRLPSGNSFAHATTTHALCKIGTWFIVIFHVRMLHIFVICRLSGHEIYHGVRMSTFG